MTHIKNAHAHKHTWISTGQHKLTHKHAHENVSHAYTNGHAHIYKHTYARYTKAWEQKTNAHTHARTHNDFLWNHTCYITLSLFCSVCLVAFVFVPTEQKLERGLTSRRVNEGDLTFKNLSENWKKKIRVRASGTVNLEKAYFRKKVSSITWTCM